MISAVFDTVIFVRGLINPRGRWGELVFRRFHQYELLVSQPIVVEILEVLQRPEITRGFRALDEISLVNVIDLLSRATVVDVDEIPAISRDPKDDMFLETARLGGAAYLVTEDQDILVLEDYASVGVKIVDSLRFLAVLRMLNGTL